VNRLDILFDLAPPSNGTKEAPVRPGGGPAAAIAPGRCTGGQARRYRTSPTPAQGRRAPTLAQEGYAAITIGEMSSRRPCCAGHAFALLWPAKIDREIAMQLTPREFDKLIIHMMAEVALKRKASGIKLNYPEAVAIISARALEGARAGKSIEEVTKDARTALTRDDVMDGVADLIPMVQVEAVFTDGSRLVTVHTPIQ
jgi:urease subunit gamma